MSVLKQASLALSLIFVSSLGYAATLTSMKKDEVMTTFSDKTVTTVSAATLDGTVISDSFTGYFSKDGKATGKFANKPNNNPQNDTGTWKVNPDGKFCFKWDHWDNGKEECVSIYKLSNSYLIINEDNGFESLILSKDIQSGNSM